MLSLRAQLSTFLAAGTSALVSSMAAAQCEFAQNSAEVNGSVGFGIDFALGQGFAAIGAPRVSTGSLEHGAVYVYSGRPELPWTWTVKDVLFPMDVNDREEFGWSVALDAGLLVVGARRGDSQVGSQNETGSVYPFIQQGDGSWLPLPRFRAASPQADEKLGESVAVSGTTIIAGSIAYDVMIPQREDTGRVVVFEPSLQDPDRWAEVQTLLPDTVTADGQFGFALAISGDTIVVGAPGSSEVADQAGAAFIYERDAGDPNHWNLAARLEPTGLNPQGDDDFGYAVDTDGQTILVGARFQNGGAVKSGRVYIYRRDPNTGDWIANSPVIINPPVGITNHANFGSSVRLSGGIALIGAPAADNAGDSVGQVHSYFQTGPTFWNPGPVFRPSDNLSESDFGTGVALRDGLLMVGDVNWGSDSGAPGLGFGRTYWNRLVPGEGDCNNDGISDGCAVALGLSPDCDGDAVPDNCPESQQIAVWLPEFKGVFSDPMAWCDTVPGPSHNAIIKSTAPDGLATEIIAIRPEQVRGIEVRQGHPQFLGAALGSLAVVDTVDAFGGFPVRIGTEPGFSALDMRGITLSVGSDLFPGSVVLAPEHGSEGSMRLEDPDTLLDVSLNLVVGDQGAGSVVLETGAQVECQELRIGSASDAQGVGSVSLVRSLGVEPSPSLTAHTQIRVERGTLGIERQCVISYGQMTIERDGVVRSDAILRGSVLNLGRVEVLSSPRDLIVQGDYRQVQVDGSSTRIGRLGLDLGSGAAGDYDRLEVNQTVALSGGLLISADASFDPPAGTQLDIIHANVNSGGGSLTGRFSVATFPGLSGLKFVRLDYDEAARTVSVVIDSLEPDQDAGFGGSQNYAVNADVHDAALGRVSSDADPDFADLVIAVGGENPGDPGAVIVFTNDGTPNGEGQQFTSQTTIALATDPIAVDVGEIDGGPNGLDDIVVASADGSVTVLRNLGTEDPSFQTFNFPGVLAGVRDVRLADLDQDSGQRNDIVLVGSDGSGDGLVMALLNLGNTGAGWAGFGLQSQVNAGPGGFVMADIGDLDNDKEFATDVVALRDDGSSCAMCHNLGGGSGVFWDGLSFGMDFDFDFQAVRVDIGDLDNDKDLDIIASGRSGDDGAFGVLLNDPVSGMGASNVFPLDGVAGPIVLANLDSDGDIDAAVAIEDPTLGPIVRTLRNDLTFDDGVPLLAFSIGDAFTTNAPVEVLLAGEVDAQAGDDLVMIEDHLGGLPDRGGRGLIASVQVRPVVPTEPPDCRVDLTHDGVVDFFDLLTFLSAYAASDPIADWNNDTLFDFFDLLGFLNAYTEGCP